MSAANGELRIEKAGQDIALVRTVDGQVRSEILLSLGEVQELARLWPEITRTMVPVLADCAA